LDIGEDFKLQINFFQNDHCFTILQVSTGLRMFDDHYFPFDGSFFTFPSVLVQHANSSPARGKNLELVVWWRMQKLSSSSPEELLNFFIFQEKKKIGIIFAKVADFDEKSCGEKVQINKLT